jgi:sulfite dehydrogenase (cytochrome) subunit B
MYRLRALFVCIISFMISAAPVCLADSKTYVLTEAVSTFRPGPGKDIAENNCLVCHSSDYISTQSPALGKKFWEAEVAKMRKAFGAQISEEDATVIGDYLAHAY